MVFPLALLFLVSQFSVTAGRDLYVNNQTGDDRANGASDSPTPADRPIRTIFRALCLAGPGDRIVLANTGEPYRESICLSGRHRGSFSQRFIVDGSGATLDGTVLAADGAWQHFQDDIFALRPRRLTYQQLFNDGAPLKQSPSLVWSPDPPALEPLQWALYQGRILFRVEKDRLPRNYLLRHAGLQTGVSLYNTEHVSIQNLILQGFQQDGMRATDNVRDCQIVKVESRANGRSGLSVDGTSQLIVKGCSFYDNGRSQLRTEGLSQLIVEQCDINEEGAVPVEHQGRRLVIDGVLFGGL
jgi:hypothetical protein